MSAPTDTAGSTGRNKPAQSGSGVSPLNAAEHKRRDAASTLGHAFQDTPSPEGATQDSAKTLLRILLAKREAGFRGRGKYHAPTAPDLEGLPEPPIGWIWASPEQLANAAPYSLGIGPFGSNLKVSDYRESGTPLIFVRNIRAEDFGLVAKFVGEQKANELAAHTAEGGDILITKMGEPPGDAAFYPVGAPKAVITADCIKWRLAEDLRVPKFFVYAIRSRLVQQQIQNRTRGVAQKKISLERFRDLAIPLPPIPEQRRIVAEIEKQFTRLEAGVAALRRVQANLKRYRAAVLKAACEGKLVPTEAEWETTTLGDVSTVLAGYGFPERLQGRSTGDIGFFKVGDISGAWKRNEKILAQANHYISKADLAELRARVLPTGTVVFAKIGAAIALNRRAIIGEPSLVDNNVMGLHAGERIQPRFLFHFLCTQKLDELARATTVPSIRKGDVEGIELKLPPLAEQKRIVAEVERRLSVVEELESVVSANLQRAARLKQSILQKAFTGELL